MPAKDEGPVQIDRHEQPKRTQRTAEEPKQPGKPAIFPNPGPATSIQESAGSPGDGFNLDAIQVEIDKEIDSLFVPAVEPAEDEEPVQIGRHEQPKRTQRTAAEPKAAVKTRNFPESGLGPGIQESAGSPGDSFDLDALQLEIDKEIDSLFVPAVEPARNEEPVQIGSQEQPKTMQGRSPVMDEQSLRRHPKGRRPFFRTFPWGRIAREI